MNGAQVSAFQANSGIAPSAMATVLVCVVFAVLLVWGVWAIRTAYVGWAETRGAGSGIMDTIRNYGYDIIMLVALLVVASMFIGVCYHAYGTYAEIHTGRKTWGQFGLTVAIGAVLLVIGIWLLTEATGIL